MPRGSGMCAMTDGHSALDPLLREGLDWITRIRAGTISAPDLQKLSHWRAQSPAHDAAFRRAELIGAMMVDVGHLYREKHGAPSGTVIPFPTKPIGRRLVLGGAIAASIAGIVTIGNMQGLFDPAADYTTGKGERRTIRLARGLSLDMDAATRIAVDHQNRAFTVGLLEGRAEVTARLANPVTVTMGKGRAVAQNARFDVLHDNGQGCVTCLEGQVRVEHPSATMVIGPNQQVAFTDDRLEPRVTVDAQEADAWKRGWLVFHHVSLDQVVHEVNRYRHGRVILANTALADRPVSGNFRIDQMDEVIGQIRQLTGARAVALPGGVLFLT